MNKSQTVFITDNLKIAAALTAAGFEIKNAESVRQNVETYDGTIVQRKTVICELVLSHHGVEANYLRQAFEEDPAVKEFDLSGQVDKIIRLRGITDNEYIRIAFDAARSALHNRSTIMHCVKYRKDLIAKSIGNGRTLIYRDGTPPEYLQKILDNA